MPIYAVQEQVPIPYEEGKATEITEYDRVLQILY